MTEAYEDGNHLVRVRAQVMIRDDSTGGWVPMGGGGLSNVSVRKRAIPCELGQCKHEYLIFGKRISDQSVVLSCIIKKDFEYNKVMPTFHHWKTGEKKFGLTFQTAADARAFDKGLRTAVDELLDGITEPPPVHNKHTTEVGDDDVFMRACRPPKRENRGHDSTQGTSNGKGNNKKNEKIKVLWRIDENKNKADKLELALHLAKDMYEKKAISTNTKTLNLPVERGDSRSSSDSSTRGSRHPTPPQEQVVQRGHLIGRGKLGSEHESPSSHTDNYPYVQLTTVREYIYPNIEASKMAQHDSSGSLKKRSLETIPPAPSKAGKKEVRKIGRQRCRYCQELFVEEENKKGACEYAPDYMQTAVDEIACIRCARCMLYHCMADAEGDFAQHPCECNSDDGCGRRWLGLALLSVLVPCLWLYPPLRACHWCGVRCGLCGGRHRPAS